MKHYQRSYIKFKKKKKIYIYSHFTVFKHPTSLPMLPAVGPVAIQQHDKLNPYYLIFLFLFFLIHIIQYQCTGGTIVYKGTPSTLKKIQIHILFLKSN